MAEITQLHDEEADVDIFPVTHKDAIYDDDGEKVIEKLEEKITTLNTNLKGFELVLDETGKATGYKTNIGGADTVFPFSSGVPICPIRIDSSVSWKHASMSGGGNGNILGCLNKNGTFMSISEANMSIFTGEDISSPVAVKTVSSDSGKHSYDGNSYQANCSITIYKYSYGNKIPFDLIIAILAQANTYYDSEHKHSGPTSIAYVKIDKNGEMTIVSGVPSGYAYVGDLLNYDSSSGRSSGHTQAVLYLKG